MGEKQVASISLFPALMKKIILFQAESTCDIFCKIVYYMYYVHTMYKGRAQLWKVLRSFASYAARKLRIFDAGVLDGIVVLF